MKFDGHIKLTFAALNQVKQNCPVAQNTCRAPMFKTELFRIWIGDSSESTGIDNYTAAVVNYIGHALTPDVLYQVKLPDAVAFVDLDERWTHDDPEGQRFHFMRAPNESERTAYENGCAFIKTHTENWVNAAKQDMKHTMTPLVSAGVGRTRDYVKELALALHSLQDSFSPGHTVRAYDELPRIPYRPGYYNHADPIREIYDYSAQDHDEHGDSDYLAGGTESAWGNLAVEASAALMTMGIVSIPTATAGLTGWEEFKRRWLQERIDSSTTR